MKKFEVKNPFRIFNGKDNQMEQFIAKFFILFVCFLLCFASILNTKFKNDALRRETTAVYTKDFKLSLTEQEGIVEGVYASQDKTKALVILKFNNSEFISSDANNFKMFLTARKPDMNYDTLQSSPNGYIYSFGSTGYMGVLLYEPVGFNNQILDLTIRNLSELTERASEDDVKLSKWDGNSFKEFDQFRVLFNPGAKDVKMLNALNTQNIDVFDIYTEAISKPAEEQLRVTLGKDLEEMRGTLKRMDEYGNRLFRNGITLGNVPSVIKDDRIDEFENPIKKEKYLRLATRDNVNKGFSFDWYNGSIAEGYIDMLRGSYNPNEYLARKAAENDESKEFNVAELIYMLDGKEFELTDLDDSGTHKTISNNIDLLTGTMNEYFQQKTKYQTQDLKSLLYLELDVKDASTNYTVNTEKDALQLY